jgi:hypothetical protein
MKQVFELSDVDIKSAIIEFVNKQQPELRGVGSVQLTKHSGSNDQRESYPETFTAKVTIK